MDIVLDDAMSAVSAHQPAQAVRALERAQSKLRWRLAATAKSAAIRSAISLATRAVKKYAWRRRDGNSWVLYGKGKDDEWVAAVRIHLGKRITLDDLRAPIQLEVLEPELVDVSEPSKSSPSMASTPE